MAGVDDGADAPGIVVAEQPDLFVVPDRLPSHTGLELASTARALSRHTLDTVQTHPSTAHSYLADGAHLFGDHAMPPAEIAQRVLTRLTAHPAGHRHPARPAAGRAVSAFPLADQERRVRPLNRLDGPGAVAHRWGGRSQRRT